MLGAEKVTTNKFKLTCTMTQSGSDRQEVCNRNMNEVKMRSGQAAGRGRRGEEPALLCQGRVRPVRKGLGGGQRRTSQGERVGSHREPFHSGHLSTFAASGSTASLG